MSENIIAIVGRPNVGKSTLFNRLTASRTAIEEKMPGVTRDRLYGLAEWRGCSLIIIDTGGITFGIDDQVSTQVRYQVNLAVEEASIILFLLDGREGLTALDQEIAEMLRKSKKHVIPVVNKLDTLSMEDDRYNFFSFGFGEPIAISASHGRGTGDLLDLVYDQVPGNREDNKQEMEDLVKVAVIGRPNVGKSSLVNTLLGKERVIVSQLPGTTREAVDTHFIYKGQSCLLIDTAGIRRKSRVKDDVEYYSVVRSLKAVQRADVALLLIDAESGITEQDQKLAGYVDQTGRGLVLVVNKWDLVRGEENARQLFLEDLKRKFSFVSYAPYIFISALSGWRLEKLFPLIMQTWQEQHKRIPTALLNELLEDILSVNPPPTVKGKRVKIFYATQPEIKPPKFIFFVNEPGLIHFSYRRYLENRLRESFNYSGTPIVVKFKKRERRGDS